MATPSSFSCPNNSDVQRASSDTAAHVHTLTRGGLTAAANGSVMFMEHRLVSPHAAGETGRRFYTPPTKESSQSSHRASTSPASSSARRWVYSQQVLVSSRPAVFVHISSVRNAYRICAFLTFCNHIWHVQAHCYCQVGCQSLPSPTPPNPPFPTICYCYGQGHNRNLIISGYFFVCPVSTEPWNIFKQT